MLKESSSVITGNDQYEGFAIDLIQEMSKILGFNYTFEVQTDNVYGSFNNITKKWNGMMGKIIDGVSKWNILPRFFFILFHMNGTFTRSTSFTSSAATFHRVHNARATCYSFLYR